jgi:hypothetical protein
MKGIRVTLGMLTSRTEPIKSTTFESVSSHKVIPLLKIIHRFQSRLLLHLLVTGWYFFDYEGHVSFHPVDKKYPLEPDFPFPSSLR